MLKTEIEKIMLHHPPHHIRKSHDHETIDADRNVAMFVFS
jgi:hypothetical protein